MRLKGQRLVGVFKNGLAKRCLDKRLEGKVW